jgi:hypothetical protein
MEPNEEFVGVAELESGGAGLSSRILQDMWAFLIATAIPPTLSASAARRRCFAGTGVVLTSQMDVGTRPPGPLGCPLCQEVTRNQFRQLLLDSFHERQGEAGGANKTDASMRRLPSAVPHLLFGKRPRA